MAERITLKHVSCVFLEVSVASMARDGTLSISLLITVFLPPPHASVVLPGITCQDNYIWMSQGVLLGEPKLRHPSKSPSALTYGEVEWGGVIGHSLIFPFNLFHLAATVSFSVLSADTPYKWQLLSSCRNLQIWLSCPWSTAILWCQFLVLHPINKTMNHIHNKDATIQWTLHACQTLCYTNSLYDLAEWSQPF